MSIQQIEENIKSSKKYQHLAPQTITRVIRYIASRYPEKQVEDKSKDLLHQIWGAYYTSRPDFKKLHNKITNTLQASTNVQEVLKQVLMIHQSSKERLPVLDNFYKKIFEITGIPNSVMDHACGLNPLTLPWMKLSSSCSYTGYDIDTEQIEFLNTTLQVLGYTNAQCKVGDIFEINYPYVDVVFMFKLIPLLQHQQKGATEQILKQQKCKFLVVSFPTKTIGGHQKGMEQFYTTNFEQTLQKINYTNFTKLEFSSEIVYVIKIDHQSDQSLQTS